MSQVTYTPASTSKRVATGVLTLGLVAAAALAPSMAAHGVEEATHLLALVRSNQPWNALLFLGLPLLLVATLAATELAILFEGGRKDGWMRHANTAAGLLAAPVMLALVTHIVLAEFRPHGHGALAPLDLLVLIAYCATTLPMVLVTLTELRMVGKDRRDVRRLHARAIAAAVGLLALAVTGSVIAP